MSRQPEVKWAQRSDKVYLTIDLPDAINPKFRIEPEGIFSFSADGYQLDLELFGRINVEESNISTSSRNAFAVLVKNENGWWTRLLKGDGKNPRNVKVDWDKWVDEDEEDEVKNNDNFDLGSMGNFSGFNPGNDDMEDEDSDSDDEDVAESTVESVSGNEKEK